MRRFQIEQRDAGVPTPTMNSIVSALRFFFTHTIDRPDLTRRLIRVAYPRNLPMVLSRNEVARLLKPVFEALDYPGQVLDLGLAHQSDLLVQTSIAACPVTPARSQMPGRSRS